MVGREGELALLRGALRTALRGRGSIVLLTGADGMGKTRLLDAATELATAAHAGVLTARAAAGDRHVPYSLITRALAPAVAARPEVVDGGAAGAASLFTDGHDRPEEVRREGLLRVVAGIATERALLLGLDDLQWADRPSLDALGYLARRISDLPVLVVAAIHPPARAAWVGGGEPLTVELGPLGPDDVATLLVARGLEPPHPHFVAACLQVTGGVPLYVDALVDEIVAHDLAPTEAAAAAVAGLAPERIAATIGDRLAALPDPVVDVLQAIAVLGEEAATGVVADLVEQPTEAVSRAARRLTDEGLLRRSDRLRFAHPVVREATLRAMPRQRRRHLHAAAATALARHGAGPATRARHLIEVPAGEVPEAMPTLRAAAATAAAGGDSGLASDYLRRSLDEPAIPAEHAEVLLELAVATSAGAPLDALPRFAAALAAATTPRQRARIAIPYGSALVATGRRHQAVEVFEGALADCPAEEPALRAEIEAGLIAAARLEPTLLPRVRDRLDALLASSARAETPGQRALLAWMALERSLAGVDRPQALALLERAVADGEIAANGADDPSFSVATGVYNLASDLEAGIALCDAGIDVARARGSRLAFATASYCRGSSQIYAGAVPDAIADLRQATAAEADGWSLYATNAHAMLAKALLEAGDLDAAGRELAAAPPGWEHSGEASILLDIRASLQLTADDPRRALEAAEQAGDRAAAAGFTNPVFPPWRLQAALAAEQLGRHQRARDLADEHHDLAQRWGSARALGTALRLRGHLRGGANGRADLEAAVDLLAASPERLQLAYALHDLGVALARHGEAPARDVLRRALDLAQRSGAGLVAGRALSALVAAGARPRRLRSTGVAALTPTERRVASLVAQGRTNADIATAQFVTAKAVERHVSSLHRKLGTRTRAELVDRLLRALGDAG